MRMLTFSFLKNCKFKTFHYRLSRYASTDAIEAETDPGKAAGDKSLIEVSPAWAVEREGALRADVLRGLRVLPDFVSEPEEAALLAELEPYLKRMRYEFDHWDNAIQGYRETERTTWRAENAAVIERVKRVSFTASDTALPHTHVLDLAASGHIKPHVDAVRFCGDVIAGICLLSPAVMRLQHCTHEDLTLDALLPRRALYIMSGVARYSFSHAVLGGEHSVWRGDTLHKGRRLSIICRTAPRAQHK